MTAKYSYYQLRTAMQQQLVASLYTEPDDADAFISGIVEAVTKRHVLLWTITPWGQTDGWCVRRTEDVQQVFIGDDTEIRLQMLLDMGHVAHKPLLSTALDAEDDILRNVMQWALQQKELISIVTAEDMYTGVIISLNDLRVTMDLLDFFGKPDGERQFPLRDILIALIDTQEEKMYKRMQEMYAQ